MSTINQPNPELIDGDDDWIEPERYEWLLIVGVGVWVLYISALLFVTMLNTAIILQDHYHWSHDGATFGAIHISIPPWLIACWISSQILTHGSNAAQRVWRYVWGAPLCRSEDHHG